MSQQVEVEKTELEILEDKLKELETLSVRKDSAAERACKELITVVMCTFASPKLAVVMNALLTFDEMQKVTTKNLSEAMALDKKQMREYLSSLKSGGYIIETTGITEWAQKQKYKNSRYNQRGGGKAAYYHVDYQYFIMMTKFRLHSILKRLNAQQKKEDDTGEGYVCCNESCYLCYKVKKIMDLLNEQSMMGSYHRISQQSHFVCSECGEPLIDAQQYYDGDNSALAKTRRFNNQMKKVRELLAETEKSVIRERQKMESEIGKLEDQMERFKSGSGHGAYKASTLTFDLNGKGKGAKTGTGLAHLDRIGRTARYRKSNWECNIDDQDNNNNSNNDQDDDLQTVQDNNIQMTQQQKVEFDRQFQKDVNMHVANIRQFEINKIQENDNIDDNNDIEMYPNLTNFMLRVNDIDISLRDILKNPEKYESEMKNNEYLRYQQALDELGLLEVD